MTDLVKRLRDPHYLSGQNELKAAELIEELERERDAAKAQVKMLREALKHYATRGPSNLAARTLDATEPKEPKP